MTITIPSVHHYERKNNLFNTHCVCDDYISPPVGDDVEVRHESPAKTTPPLTPALSDYSKKDSKWDVHRANAQSVGDLYDQNPAFKREGDRMYACSNLLEFRQISDDIFDANTGKPSIRLFRAHFCKVRNCPVCSWRKMLRNMARFQECLPEVLAEYPRAQFLFLTLTFKNPEMDNLRTSILNANTAFKRLIQRKDWPGKGYVKSVEITLGKDGNPHPHFHVLILVNSSYFKGGNYLSQAAWTEMWQDALRVDYVPIVNVKKVRAISEKSKALGEIDGERAALNAAILETFKYQIKPGDMIDNPDFLYGITKQLHKMRFFATGGVLKDCMKEEVSTDEMINTGTEDKEEKVNPEEQKKVSFLWRKTELKYRKTRDRI